jgi:predicted nucleotidyltransferase component of viral defense system
MIPADAVTAWSVGHPWPTEDQVEQDLILSRAMCAIASDSYLSEELVFRGGTALHKLHLPTPRRYSEDLDYVRSSAGGIGVLMRRLTDLGDELGFTVGTGMSEHPKVYWRTMAESGNRLRIKVEVDTRERSPVMLPTCVSHRVESSWWTGEAQIRTYQTAELIASTLRALYARSKGRDVFDIWLALTELTVDPGEILRAFRPIRPVGFTAKSATANLQAKLADADFRHDVDGLSTDLSPPYDLDQAATMVVDELLSQV